jgi:hypothetical protein
MARPAGAGAGGARHRRALNSSSSLLYAVAGGIGARRARSAPRPISSSGPVSVCCWRHLGAEGVKRPRAPFSQKRSFCEKARFGVLAIDEAWACPKPHL